MNLSLLCTQSPIPVKLNSLMCICKAHARNNIKKQEQILINIHENIHNLKPVSKKLKQMPVRKLKKKKSRY